MYKFLIIISVFLFSCLTTENRTKVEEKKKIVMDIHDIAMEKMGDMAKLKKSLKSKIVEDSTQTEKLTKAILNLENADKLMWDWMHNYHNETVDTSKVENALKYLDKQYQDVKIVEQKINKSLENGESLL